MIPGPPAPPACSGCGVVGADQGKTRHKQGCIVAARARRVQIIESLIREALNKHPLPLATWEAAKAIDALTLSDQVGESG